MRKIVYLVVVMAVVLAAGSCKTDRRQQAYERMIDSIRRAETSAALLRQSEPQDPVRAYFDTLALRPLPLQYSEGYVLSLPSFKPIPKSYYPIFNYEETVELRAISLPEVHNHRVLMVSERIDAHTLLFLYTMTPQCDVIDHLCVYETKEKEKSGKKGTSYMEFFITSDHEITLLTYFRADDADEAVLEQSRRYVISHDGYFEETIIEL